MSRTWKFADVEFMALWSRTQATHLPRPFTYISDIQSADDYERALHVVRDRWRSKPDPALDEISEAVLRPDVALEVRGYDDREYKRPEGWVRLLAVRKENRGYLLKQLTGKTFEHAAGFTVTECDPLRLADQVVAELPKADAGKQGTIKLPVPKDEEMADTGKSGLWDDPWDNANPVSSERFEKTVAASRGVVLVYQGYSVFGPRGRLRCPVQWRDLPDDGRYLIAPDPPPVAQPADGKKFVAVLNNQIAKIIRNIKDERQSHRV
ncbi:ESX secretion-associated protein EspG [Nocardia sp. NPDC048505]|uniref:ESX secretion-associated protein EspG n=1 Tax=Nocardia sp. NPDC048505 TaxID=3155756 RepID=UPI0033F77F00